MAVGAAVNAAIGAYYYLRVMGVMYLRTPLRPIVSSRAIPTLVAAVMLASASLFFGMFPNSLMKAARHAAPVPEIRANTATDVK
jgi:NADH-quinone oxidoreductase subunit N